MPSSEPLWLAELPAGSPLRRALDSVPQDRLEKVRSLFEDASYVIPRVVTQSV
jgi:hypothetical protein